MKNQKMILSQFFEILAGLIIIFLLAIYLNFELIVPQFNNIINLSERFSNLSLLSFLSLMLLNISYLLKTDVIFDDGENKIHSFFSYFRHPILILGLAFTSIIIFFANTKSTEILLNINIIYYVIFVNRFFNINYKKEEQLKPTIVSDNK